MADLCISLSAARRHHARRHWLTPGRQRGDLLELVRGILALHATEPSSIYLSAWARLPGFQRSRLDRALFEERSLVRWMCMRRTLFVLPSADVAMFHQACVPRLLGSERRRLHKLFVMAELSDEAGAPDLAADLEARVLAVVGELGQAFGKDLTERVPEMKATFPYGEGRAWGGRFSLAPRVNYLACMGGGMVRTRPRGTWRSNQHSYALRTQWLPDLDLESWEQAEARSELARRYIEAFGPVSLDDIQWWTGFTKTHTRQALAALGVGVATVRLEEHEAEQYAIADQLEALAGAEPLEPTHVALLPTLDPLIMGYRDRRRFLDEPSRELLFDRNGNAGPSVWAGGRVLGGWAQAEDGRIVWRLFGEPGGAVESALEARAASLPEFLGEHRVLPNFPTPQMKELKGR